MPQAWGSQDDESTQHLVTEVHRAYTGGATEQQLHAIAAAVAVYTGVQMPGGGVSEWGEFVLDFHNWARHMVSPRPPPLRPGARPQQDTHPPVSHQPPPSIPNPPPHMHQQHMQPPNGGGGGLQQRGPQGTPARPQTAPPPQTRSPLVNDVDDETTLATPRDAGGLLDMLDLLTNGNPEQDLPLGQLNAVAKHVSTISARKMPALVVQKRHFVRGWHHDTRARLGRGPDGSPMKKTQMGAGEVFAELDARINAAQRSITQSEIPEIHVDLLAEQIAGLMGVQMPTLTRDRRQMIEKWHGEQKRAMRRR